MYFNWRSIFATFRSLLKRFEQRHAVQKIESPLSLSFSQLVWNHTERQQIGTRSEVKLTLMRANGTVYALKFSDQFSCLITHVSSDTPVQHEVQPAQCLVGHSEVRVAFTAEKLGRYRVVLCVNGREMSSHRTFVPGPLDVTMTELAPIPNPKIATKDVFFTIKLFPRDSHGNSTTLSEQLCQVDIKKRGFTVDYVQHTLNGEETADHELVVRKAVTKDGYELCLKLKESGHYTGTIMYNGKVLGRSCFPIICLTSSEMQSVRITVDSGKHVSYKAELFMGGKLTKVQCLVTPQALEIRKYKLAQISQLLYSCPISPTRKITLHEGHWITVDNGSADPIRLLSEERNIIAATFSKIALQNMGGSECFQKKKVHFYEELKKTLHHRIDEQRELIPVLVDRWDVLNSAMKATKNFSVTDWQKKFDIEFAGEDGLDFGGPSKEFIELLSHELFSGTHGCFIRLDEDSQQAPVHPNPAHTCYQHLEFAGKLVGKCLLECALENVLLLKVNFTTSFLAQLINLKVDYSYYENDDPVYFRNKIQYTLKQDVTEDDLFYTDSADDSVALVKDGGKRRVTQANKHDYLNQLALFRLAKRPCKQTKCFMKGLTEIIPNNLLLMFTIHELKLLLCCGTSELSFEDMKAHSQVECSKMDCPTLEWFWSIVEDFAPHERATLLQFVTGSSLLPQGGFKYLKPPFAISITSPQKGRLPSAHTCINQLYLPQYGSKEELCCSLKRALREIENGFPLC